jgi:hypothetical protein
VSRSKKTFIVVCILFFAGLIYLSYDISSKTTFPGSKSQLKERLKKQYLVEDSLKADTSRAVQRP